MVQTFAIIGLHSAQPLWLLPFCAPFSTLGEKGGGGFGFEEQCVATECRVVGAVVEWAHDPPCCRAG